MSTKLPPSERDFEIYDAIHIACSSTRCQAELHHISQTRVRQIIRRVIEWLGEVLPPQTKVAKEQETHLARQIAADRFQRQLEQITALWDATLDTKFASIRIRLTTAQARLGVVGGLIDGLAADAIEGLPVPACVNHESTEGEVWEGEAPAEPVGQLLPSATIGHRAAPQSEICNLKSGITLPPPHGDCSPSDENPRDREPAGSNNTSINHDASATCNNSTANQNDSSDSESIASQALLTTRAPLPVTVRQLDPNQPTAAPVP